jgi:hypothetical protein
MEDEQVKDMTQKGSIWILNLRASSLPMMKRPSA